MSKTDSKVEWEFGGPVGVTALMLWSHGIVLYLWLSLEYYDGGVFVPTDLPLLWSQLVTGLAPNLTSVAIYFGFWAIEIIFAFIMPGPIVKGLPVPEEGGKVYDYLCNALWAWYATLLIAGGLHYTEVMSISLIADNLGRIMFLAMISSNCIAVFVYIAGLSNGKAVRMTGNHIYDFFMGSYLNPRVGYVDVKIFAEIRLSWMTLFFLSLSALVKQYETVGHVTGPMWLIFVAHGLYSNACMKGEECIPTSWDIIHEKWGWMLVYWNFTGVPFVYCFQAHYILKNGPFEFSTLYLATLFIVLVCAYYFWDSAQA